MKAKFILLATLICLIGLISGNRGAGAGETEREPVEWVDPLIDTANSRWFFFSSACRPFGLVNLSPDMVTAGDWGAGYRYDEDKIRAFSHLHGWQLSGVPVMPVTGAMRGPEGADAYGSRFSHERETVRPGYHEVMLDDYGIKVELTSTDRVGFHRYTFPEGQPNFILFDLGMELGPARMKDFSVRRAGPNRIEGRVTAAPTRRRPKELPIFFVAEFERPLVEFGGWKGNQILSGELIEGGPGGGAFVRVENGAVLMKVAISYCDIEGARKNLESELPHWDFGRVVRESRETWNGMLSRIAIDGGTPEQRVRFYTDLWHALQGRRKWSDADGRYSDFTGPERRIRQIPLGDDGKPRYDHYNSDAFWGAQWGIGLLWSLAYPEVMSGFVNSMVDMYKDGGLIPRGPAGGNYTFVMTGASSTPFIVSAWLKGIRDFDVETGYEGLRKNHFPGGMMSRAGYEHNSERGGGIEYYIKRGYIPDPRFANAYHVSGAGQTLEYSYQDYCLAQLAGALGNTDDQALFLSRAGNYRNLFDSRLKLMRPRTVLGTWLYPFSPASRVGWVEGNALQFTWFAPHDVEGLIQLFGGRDQFIGRLNKAFEDAEPRGFVSRSAGYEGAINYGNQPNMHVAHLFNYAGAPWLAQKWARQVKDRVFSGTSSNEGYFGDEDQGLGGSLSVLLAIGLFDVQGGCNPEPLWQISSPIFDRVTIKLNPRYYSGGEFVIETAGNFPGNIYIQKASLNGSELTRPWITHAAIAFGGTLRLELGPEPNREWGSRPEDSPPSMTAPLP